MDAAREAVCRKVLGYAPLVDAECAAHPMDRWLLLALICQESLGNQYAVRPEPAFWLKYGAKFTASAKGNAVRWCKFPDLASASYGLCQPLYVVSVELGFDPIYPTDLCDPTLNIAVGAKKLRQCIRPMGTETDPIRAALLRYNGGGFAAYPDKVLQWRKDIMGVASGTQPT